MFWKDDLSKNLHYKKIFLLLPGKKIFILPKNIILFFKRKKKYYLSQKIHEKICIVIWSFLYCQEQWYFFFLKKWSCSLDGKLKIIFPKKKWTNDVLCIFAKYGISFLYKYRIKPKIIFSQKIHLKVIFLVSLRKMIFILSNTVFPLIEKLKIIQKFA